VDSAVSAYIDAQPQREILLALRAVVRKVVPDVREEMKWRVPFYSHHGMLCAFELSGRDVVVLCLCYGAELDDPEGLMGGNWVRTRTIRIRTVREARRRALADLLSRAARRNEAHRKGREETSQEGRKVRKILARRE
jgi:hypothetical protein